jgi:hypothetical protein
VRRCIVIVNFSVLLEFVNPLDLPDLWPLGLRNCRLHSWEVLREGVEHGGWANGVGSGELKDDCGGSA